MCFLIILWSFQCLIFYQMLAWKQEESKENYWDVLYMLIQLELISNPESINIIFMFVRGISLMFDSRNVINTPCLVTYFLVSVSIDTQLWDQWSHLDTGQCVWEDNITITVWYEGHKITYDDVCLTNNIAWCHGQHQFQSYSKESKSV